MRRARAAHAPLLGTPGFTREIRYPYYRIKEPWWGFPARILVLSDVQTESLSADLPQKLEFVNSITIELN